MSHRAEAKLSLDRLSRTTRRHDRFVINATGVRVGHDARDRDAGIARGDDYSRSLLREQLVSEELTMQ